MENERLNSLKRSEDELQSDKRSIVSDADLQALLRGEAKKRNCLRLRASSPAIGTSSV